MARRLLVLAAPVVLLAGGWLIFYVLKDPPRADGCYAATPRDVHGYRRGLGAYATLSACALGALIAWTSRTRRTGYALAACAWLMALYNLEDDAFVPHATFGFVFGMFGGELLLGASAIATLVMGRPQFAQLAYLWTALLVILPGAAGIVASEGDWALCMS